MKPDRARELLEVIKNRLARISTDCCDPDAGLVVHLTVGELREIRAVFLPEETIACRPLSPAEARAFCRAWEMGRDRNPVGFMWGPDVRRGASVLEVVRD